MPREETATPVAIEPEGDWHGLYTGSTSRDDHLFTAESVRHPAKMSLALTNKILDTMQEWGWIETGSLVVDPFGGRGTTALCWISRHPANRALTVELEPHFVEMQQKNKEHAERRLHRELAWVILQGDSRRFAEYYAEGKAASILSPPYEAQSGGTGPASEKGYMAERGMQQYHAASNTNLGYAEGKAASVLSAPYGPKGVHDHDAEREARFAEARGRTKESVQQYIEGDYGSTPGQIGNLPDSAITSAPYSGDVKHDRTFAERDARADETKDLTNACGRGSFRGSPTYGDTPGQIGRLKDPPAASVLSAPYAAAENRRAAGKVQEGEVSDAITRAYDATNHGQTAGNIANLPDACVTSAPWESGLASNVGFIAPKDSTRLMGATYTDPAAAVTSAPWENSLGESAGVNIPQRERAAQVTGKSQAGVTPIDVRDRAAGTAEQKSHTDACVTSAPFEDSLASDDPEKRGGFLKSDPKRRNDPGLTATYGDAAAVTSAPWEATPGGGTPSPTGVLNQGVSERHMASRIGKTGGYADNQQGQIGVLQAESYADACGKVYASLAKAGIRFVCSVTKDPVRKKRLRPLRLLTISLFEKAGYRLVAWRRAWLYHTQAELDAMAGQESLFGDEVEESKRLVGRLSFFRRLSLNRGGVASQWEDVLFFELDSAR